MFDVFNLIYEHDVSLTDEVIDDLLASFQADPNPHVVMYDPSLTRVKRFILNEITKHLHVYIKTLNGDKQTTVNTPFFSPLLSQIQKNVSNLVVHQRDALCLTMDRVIVENCKTQEKVNQAPRTNMLNVVWFLHDYDGALQFGNHLVSPKKGKIIIYPVSWCVPVSEFIANEAKVTTLRSTVFV